MPQGQANSLLWVNKDASNVHRRKHVAEVNAHVQKSNLMKRVPKKQTDRKKAVVATRQDEAVGANSPLSSGSTSNSSRGVGDTDPSTANGSIRSSGALMNRFQGVDSNMPTALIVSSYREDDDAAAAPLNGTEGDYDFDDNDFQLSQLIAHLNLSPATTIDASNPLPGLISGMSSHDKMLVHTHLTYMPSVYYGLSTSAVYCPIRTASVVNMLGAPVGMMWVLISLDMFLETARKSNARRAIILQRKSRAYQLMSDAFSSSSQSGVDQQMLGPAAAAIAELFCGDPVKALTHLNGISAFITSKGGIEFVKQMDPTISMPVFAVSAYRAILQDNLTSVESFERARTSFIGNLKWLRRWNADLANFLVNRSQSAQDSSSDDEGFDGGFDFSKAVEELQQARERAFIHHPLIQKFVGIEFDSSKAGEKVDHFIILYNLNVALADHDTNVKQAAQFVEDLIDDAETGGSTKGADSSLKISGFLRLLTNRQAKLHLEQPSAGVARAWSVLDALEIMKLFSSELQRSVCETLHSLLVGRENHSMLDPQFSALNSAITTEWQVRHPHLSLSRGFDAPA